MNLVDILKAAKAKIEQGWTQRSFCVEGAILSCNAPGLLPLDALRYLQRAIDTPLPWWNDAPGRTQAEVLAAFDRAIQIATEDAK
jgi:hypothetical protein